MPRARALLPLIAVCGWVLLAAPAGADAECAMSARKPASDHAYAETCCVEQGEVPCTQSLYATNRQYRRAQRMNCRGVRRPTRCRGRRRASGSSRHRMHAMAVSPRGSGSRSCSWWSGGVGTAPPACAHVCEPGCCCPFPPLPPPLPPPAARVHTPGRSNPASSSRARACCRVCDCHMHPGL